MPCPDDPGRPPESHQCDSFAWASRLRTRWPPASPPPFRGCTRPQGGAVSLTAYMVPCVRFKPFVRLVSRLASYGPATLGTGGWLDLTRQGLAPCKKRQACLGAHAAEGERAGTAPLAVSVRSTVGLAAHTEALRILCSFSSLAASPVTPDSAADLVIRFSFYRSPLLVSCRPPQVVIYFP
jgi:hypothetical protein